MKITRFSFTRIQSRELTISKKQSAQNAKHLFSKLREALIWNRSEEVRSLLEAGANPLDENEENAQLLTHAALSNNPALIKLMISLGCSPNHTNINGRTPLHDAAYSGKTKAVRMLLHAGANINAKDNRLQTPLLEALRNKHPKTAIELIMHGAEIFGRDATLKKPPLMWAVSMKNPELVTLILQKAASELEVRDGMGCTPLMHAARSGSPEMVQLLLDSGADITARDRQGNDAFHWCSSLSPETSLLILNHTSFSPEKATWALLKAAGEQSVEVINVLVSRNATIQPVEEGGESALVRSVHSKCSEVFRLLLTNPSADINYRSGKRLRTALTTAAIKGDVDKTRMLLDARADCEIPDVDGRKPIHFAAANAKLEVLKLLESKGAGLHSLAPGNRTLLHLAAYDTEAFAKERQRVETFQWLLDQNIDPDSADNSGLTPLMTAAYHAKIKIVRLLINAGANLDLTDDKGRTALFHAACFGTEFGRNERYLRPKNKSSDRAAPVMMALLEAGANPNKTALLNEVSQWRWPGAMTLLKRHGATIEKP